MISNVQPVSDEVTEIIIRSCPALDTLEAWAVIKSTDKVEGSNITKVSKHKIILKDLDIQSLKQIWDSFEEATGVFIKRKWKVAKEKEKQMFPFNSKEKIVVEKYQPRRDKWNNKR